MNEKFLDSFYLLVHIICECLGRWKVLVQINQICIIQDQFKLFPRDHAYASFCHYGI